MSSPCWTYFHGFWLFHTCPQCSKMVWPQPISHCISIYTFLFGTGLRPLTVLLLSVRFVHDIIQDKSSVLSSHSKFLFIIQPHLDNHFKKKSFSIAPTKQTCPILQLIVSRTHTWDIFSQLQLHKISFGYNKFHESRGLSHFQTRTE